MHASGLEAETDERLIPVSPMLHSILMVHFQSRRSDRFVFANEAGNRETHMLEKLRPSAKRSV